MGIYAKIWTDVLHDEWFLGLNGQQRGVWLQLIIHAKAQGDTGRIVFPNRSFASQSLGVDRSVFVKNLVQFENQGKISILTSVHGVSKYRHATHTNDAKVCTECAPGDDLSTHRAQGVGGNNQNILVVEIINYHKWQRDTAPGGRAVRDDKSTRSAHPYNRVEKSRVDTSNIHSPAAEKIPYEPIVEHLNQVTNRQFKWQSDSTQKLIRGRWHEGFREQDFFYVHVVKTEEWLGTDREQYLRPKTLYNASNFEGYRNQRRGVKPVTEKARNNIISGIQWLKDQGFDYGNEGQARICQDDPETGEAV